MRYLPGGRISTCGPFWPPVREKRLAVLKAIVAVDVAAEDVARLQRAAVDRLDEADFVLRDHGHRHLAHDVDERRLEVQAGREHGRLEADLALHGDDAAWGQGPSEELALEDADLLAANVDGDAAKIKQGQK